MSSGTTRRWKLIASIQFFFFYGATALIVLAFSTISFHLRRSCTCSAHFVSSIFFRSFLTSSSHSRLGLSCWSSCEWFSSVYSLYYARFGHPIYVSASIHYPGKYHHKILGHYFISHISVTT